MYLLIRFTDICTEAADIYTNKPNKCISGTFAYMCTFFLLKSSHHFKCPKVSELSGEMSFMFPNQ